MNCFRSKRRSMRRKLAILRRKSFRSELLEDRHLLAATTLDLSSNVLTYTGDSSANELQIEVAGGVYTFTPGSGDTISLTGDTGHLSGGGSAGAAVTVAATANVSSISVDLFSGNDQVTVSSSDDPLTLSGGLGDDTYRFGNGFNNATVVEAADQGADKIDLSSHTGTMTVSTTTIANDTLTSSDTSKIVQSTTRAEVVDAGLSASDVTSLKTTLDSFESYVTAMANSSTGLDKLTHQLPLLDREDSASVATTSGLFAAVNELVTKAKTAIDGTNSLSAAVDAINAASLQTSSNLTTLSLTATPNYQGQVSGVNSGQFESLIDLQVAATATGQTFDLDLGDDADLLGLDVDATVTVGVTTTLDFSLAVGESSTFVVPGAQFDFVVDGSAPFSSATPVNFGLLKATIGSGSLLLDGKLRVTVNDEVDANGQIDLSSFSSTNVSTTVTDPDAGDGYVDSTVSVTVPAGVKIGATDVSTATFGLTTSDPFSGASPTLSLKSGTDDLMPFGNLKPNELLGMIGSVADALTSLSQHPDLGVTVPFAGLNVSQGLDFNSAFKRALLDPLFTSGDSQRPDVDGDGDLDTQPVGVDGDAADLKFDSIQSLMTLLQTEVNQAFGNTAGTTLNAIFDPASNQLSFALGFKEEDLGYGAAVVETLQNGTAADGGQNEQQKLTVHATDGGNSLTDTFRLGLIGANGLTTWSSAIAYNATAATIDSAIEAISGVGSGNVTVTDNGDGTKTIEFNSSLASVDVPQLVTDSTQLVGAFPLDFAADLEELTGLQSDSSYALEGDLSTKMTFGVDLDPSAAVEISPSVNSPEDANVTIEPVDPSATHPTTQTIVIENATHGSYKLAYGSNESAAISLTETAANLETKIEAISGVTSVSVTGNATSGYTVTFTDPASPTLLTANTTDLKGATDGILSGAATIQKIDIKESSLTAGSVTRNAATTSLTSIAIARDTTNTSFADLVDDVRVAINTKYVSGGNSLGWIDSSGNLTTGALGASGTTTATHTPQTVAPRDIPFRLKLQLSGGTTESIVNGSILAVDLLDADSDGRITSTEANGTLTASKLATELKSAIDVALERASVTGFTIATSVSGGKLKLDVSAVPTASDTLELIIDTPFLVEGSGGRISIAGRTGQFSYDELQPPVSASSDVEVYADFLDPAYDELGILSAPTRYDGKTTDAIEFTVTLDGTPVSVVVPASSAHTSLDQLVTAINGQLDTALVAAGKQAGDVLAFRYDPVGNRVGLRGKAGTVAKMSIYVPETLTVGGGANGAISELGLSAGQGETKRGRVTDFFFDNVDLDGDLKFRALGSPTVQGEMGLVDVTATVSPTINNESASPAYFATATLDSSLKDPYDGDSSLTFDTLVDTLGSGHFLHDATATDAGAQSPPTGLLDGSLTGEVGLQLALSPQTGLSGLSALDATATITSASADWLLAPPKVEDALGLPSVAHNLSSADLELSIPDDGHIPRLGIFVSDGSSTAIVTIPETQIPAPRVTIETEAHGTSSTDEIQKVRVTDAAGGTFTLSFAGQTTTAIAAAASASDVKAKLEALTEVTAVTVTRSTLSNGFEYTVTFNTPSNDVSEMEADAGGLLVDYSSFNTTLQSSINAAVTSLGGGATVTVATDATGQVTISSSDSVSVRGNVLDVSYAGSDVLGLLDHLDDLSLSDILVGLREVVNVLQGLADKDDTPLVPAFNTQLPLLGQSLADLIDLGDRMLEVVEEIEADPDASLQELDAKLKSALGITSATPLLTLDTSTASQPKINFSMALGLSEQASMPFNLDLDSVGGLPDIFTDLVGVSASGNLDVEASGTFHLEMGLDLAGASPGFYLKTGETGTRIVMGATATGNDLDFSAQLGPFGVFVLGGQASIAASATAALLDPDEDGRLDLVAYNDASFTSDVSRLSDFVGTSSITVTGTGTANLPIFVGQEDAPVAIDGGAGTANSFGVTVDMVEALDGDADAGLSITLPNVDFSTWQPPSLFQVLADPAMVVDGLDIALANVQDALEGELFGIELPFLGDVLADNPATQFVADIRNDLLKPLANTLRNSNANLNGLIDLIQTTIHDTFNNDTIQWLKDLDEADGISKADVLHTGFGSATGSDSDDWLQLEFELGTSTTFTLGDFEFDLGVPGFSIDAAFTPTVTFSWTLHIGFGVSTSEGFYFYAGDGSGDPELTVSVVANFSPPNSRAKVNGQLGFLALNLTDGVDLNQSSSYASYTYTDDDENDHTISEMSGLSLTGTVDIVDPGGDGRLTISEIASTPLLDLIQPELVGAAFLRAEAEVDFSVIDPSLSNILPSISTSIVFDRYISATPTGGITISDPEIFLADIELDLGSFISDFAGPLMEEIQDVIGPLDWLLGPDGFLNKRIPLLSDLAGKTITGKDLIVQFDPVRGPTVVAVLNAIEQLYFLVNLVADASREANGSAIVLPFGDLVVYGDATELAARYAIVDSVIDLNLPSLSDLKNLKNAKLPSLPSKPSLPKATGSKTRAFTKGVSDPGGINFTIFQPETIFKLLLGQPDVTLFTYELPEMEFEFFYRQSFHIFGPIVGTFAGRIGGGLDVGFGYDTRGLSQFLATDNPLTLINGFFLSDIDFATGYDRPEAYLNAEIAVGAGLDFGIASAGVEGGIAANIDFNLADIDDDGKIRWEELAANIVANSYNPLAIFDVSGKMEFFLRAYFEIDLWFTSITKTYEFTRLTLFEFSDNFTRPSVLSGASGDTLIVNVGPNAAQRLKGNTTDGAETIHVGGTNASVQVWSDSFNVPKLLAPLNVGVKTIVIDAGAGADTINLSQLNAPGIDVIVRGGAGNDVIIGAANAKSVTIYGDDGNDTITGGAAGEIIYGGAGNDTINSGSGNDTVNGGSGNDAINGGDGNDVLDGGAGDDTITRSAGDDSVKLNNFGSTDVINGNSGTLTLDFEGKTQKLSIFLQHGQALVGYGEMKSGVTTNSILATTTFETTNDPYFEHQLVVTDTKDLKKVIGGSLDDTFHVSGTKSDTTIDAELDGDKGNDKYRVYLAGDGFTSSGKTQVKVNDTGNPWNSGDLIQVLGTSSADTVTMAAAATGVLPKLDFGTDRYVKYVAPEIGNNILSVKIEGEGGNDQVTIAGTEETIPVRVDGGQGDDTVTVGSGTLANIKALMRPGLNSPYGLGPLVLLGAEGTDTVIFDASAETNALTGELTAFTEDRPGETNPIEVGVVSGLGMSLKSGSTAGTGRVEFEGFATVDVKLGTKADNFDVGTETLLANLPPNRQGEFSSYTHTIAGNTIISGNGDNDTIDILKTQGTLTVHGGAGSDTLNLQTAMSSVALNGDAGSDTFNLGSLAPTLTNGKLDAIDGLVTLDGGADTDTANVDDSGSSNDTVSTLTNNSLVGLNLGNNASDKGLRYTTLENLNVDSGSGADVFNIQSTSATTDIDLMAGGDAVFISSTASVANITAAAAMDYLDGNLDGIVGNLNVDAGAGDHILMVSDATDSTGDGTTLSPAIITASTITGLSTGGITYGATGGTFGGGISLWSGSGDDTITVDSTRKDTGLRTVTLLNTLGGADKVTVDLSSTDDFFVVNTGDGDDTIDASTTDQPLVLIGGDGSDSITGSSNNDVIFGDRGLAEYHVTSTARMILGNEGTGNLISSDPLNISVAKTTHPTLGGDDVIVGGLGGDIVLGGPGADTITAGGDSLKDVIVGDLGTATFNAAGSLIDILSTDTTVGAGDQITAGNGTNVLIGGTGADTINGGTAADIVLADHGHATFDASSNVTLAESVSPTLGGNDIINVGNGPDVVVAGPGDDDVDAGLDGSRDILVGDSGRAVFDPTTFILTSIQSLEPTTGGSDELLAGDGDDVVIAGNGADFINVDRDTEENVGVDTGNDVLVGDNGIANFASDGTLLSVATNTPEAGGDDKIFASDGSDTVLGGSGADAIDGGTDGSRDIVVGDNGSATFAANGALATIQTSDPTYGGNDTIEVGNGSDVVIAGFGMDMVDAGADSGADVIVGDGGSATFDTDSGSSLLRSISTTSAENGDSDTITAGNGPDVIFGGTGDDDIEAGTDTSRDILLGDNGNATFNAAGVLTLIQSTDGTLGGSDELLAGDGPDIVIAGAGADFVNYERGTTTPVGTDSGADVILGDSGQATFTDAGILVSVTTTDVSSGGADNIFASDGPDTVFGGSGDDQIDAGTDASRDVVVGDNGTATFAANGALADVRTTDPTDGGDDTIEVGDGDDVVIGGFGFDTINAGTDAGADVIVGDSGYAQFDTDSGSSLLRETATTDAASGRADTINAGNGPDVILGGSGDDNVNAGSDNSRDILLGDNGIAEFDVSGVLTRVATLDGSLGGSDQLLAGDGDDVIIAGVGNDYVGYLRDATTTVGSDSGADVIVGDSGEALFAAGILLSVQTSDVESGGIDFIFASDGPDTVFGGSGGDTINAGTDGSADVVVGDNGVATFASDGVLTHITTNEPDDGGDDQILVGDGTDVVLGGSGADNIDAGTDASRDITVGDNGFAVFDSVGVLTEIRTIDWAIGGDDQILVGNGDDVVLGGIGTDDIDAGTDAGADVIVGDNGFALFDNVSNMSVIRRIETSFASQGGDDQIQAGNGFDVVFGGSGADDVDAGTDTARDILLGDNGRAEFDEAGVLINISTSDDDQGASDELLGGDGDDVIFGGFGVDYINVDEDTQLPVGVDSGADVIVGDNGFAIFDNVADASLLRQIETKSPEHAGGDLIFASDGPDTVLGGGGEDFIDAGTDDSRDIVVGDNGVANFDATGVLISIATLTPDSGGADTIQVRDGDDVVLGGFGADNIDAGTDDGADVILGDNGLAQFDNNAGASLLRRIETSDAEHGSSDQILAGDGPDVVLAGSGADDVDAGTDTSRDILLGDNGFAVFDASGVLTEIRTSDPSLGDEDQLLAGDGDDVVFGGAANDYIGVDRNTLAQVGVDSGADVIVGDNGFALFDNVNSQSLLRQIETSDPTDGGDDLIFASDGPDVVFGGSGSDDVDAGTDTSRDILVGDNGAALFDATGVLVDLRTTHPDIGGNDELLAGDGDDVVIGGFGVDHVNIDRETGDNVGVDSGDDVILGDNGLAVFDNLAGASLLRDIQTTFPSFGGNDFIFAAEGSDIVLAGSGADEVDAGSDTSRDIVVGDNGAALFDAAGILYDIRSTAPATGGDDRIIVGNGDDVVIAGVANDTVDAGTDTGADIVVGDNGFALFDTDGGFSLLRQIETSDPSDGGNDEILAGNGDDVVLGGSGDDDIDAGTDSGRDVVVGDNGQAMFTEFAALELVTSTAPSIGGDDDILVGDGDDVVIGGFGKDFINASRPDGPNPAAPLGTDEGKDIILGDNGMLTFRTSGSESLIQTARTTDATLGDDDWIFAGNGFDVVLGGTARDIIDAGSDTARDVVVGDNGEATFNASEVLTYITTTDPDVGDADQIWTRGGSDIVLGGLADDTIDAGTDAGGDLGDDVVMGDNGNVTMTDEGIVTDIRTSEPHLGSTDNITTGGGDDIVFGGLEVDTIDTGAHEDADIVVGDHGIALFDSTDGARILRRIESTDVDYGHGDFITAGNGPDVVIGGTGGDDVDAGLDASRDIVVGDNAIALFDVDQTLLDIRTIAPDVGGDDELLVGDGPDVVLGGVGTDHINVDRETVADVGVDDGDDVIVGDNGFAIFDNDNGSSLLRQIETTDPEHGHDDFIFAADGSDVVLGGSGNDDIEAGSDGSADIVVGDNGRALFDAAGVLRDVRTLVPDVGGADVIRAGDGPDVVLGGFDNDDIQTGYDDARDIVVGDNGLALFNENAILTYVRTDSPSLGGDDTISTTNGPDVVFGGTANDTIDAGTDLDGDVGDDIVLGDNGEVVFSELGDVNLVQTTDPEIGGMDVITSGGGDDLVFGGTTDDQINSGTGDDLVLGDNGIANFTAIGQLTDLTTTDPTIGGVDLIHTDAGDDVVFGGAAGDEIHAGDDHDLVFGDHATLDFIAHDTDPLTRDLAETIDPLEGGQDTINGDAGRDYLFGGTDDDTINGGADHDVILGDHGRWDRTLPVNQDFESIFITDDDGAGEDTIHGDGGDDFILGQQHSDLIYGDADEDDIWGGHNVLYGDDVGDTIYGGDHADVILGDNGLITRTLLPNEVDQWERYPAPFPDVIRDVTRYDDVDRVAGDDTIYGDAGDDIVHGQRGDDTIDGGSGDDELLGELGDDTMFGGDDNDWMLADVGVILRDFLPNGAPRINENGSWHRDLFLEDVGTVAGNIPMGLTPLATNDPQLARKLLTTDLLVAAGSYDANGAKRRANANAPWETSVLLVDLVDANDDTLDGGAGEDVILGQRGNDTLRGGSDDDIVIGDGANNQIPFLTELPHIWSGVRLIDIASDANVPIELRFFGSVISAPLHVQSEEMRTNDPYSLPDLMGNIVPDVIEDFRAENSVSALTRSDGGSLRPYASIVPNVIHHQDVLPGADQVFGDDGDDLLFGDTADVFSPLLTGMQATEQARDAARDAFDRAMHTAGSLTLDYENWQNSLGANLGEHAISVAGDTVDGGAGADVIFGDQGLIVGSFELGLPVSESSFQAASVAHYNYLRDLEMIGNDLDYLFFEAQHLTLSHLIQAANGQAPAKVDPNLHDLFIGNDTIRGGGGDDLIVGDQGVIITEVVTGERFELIQLDTHVSDTVWNSTETTLNNLAAARDQELDQHVAAHHDRSSRNHSAASLNNVLWDFEYELWVGNDNISGEQGNDLITADFGAFGMPVALKSPRTIEERVQLEQDVKELADNVARYLETRHHRDLYARTQAQYQHAYYGERGGAASEVKIVAGSDVVFGNDGNDFILGDSESVSATYRFDAARRFEEPDPEFKVNFLIRENFELINHYKRDGVSSISEDVIRGGNGNDYIYGQTNDDQLFGEGGNDIVFGGRGQNSVNGGAGQNDVRAGSDDRPEEALLDVMESYWFSRITPWTEKMVRDLGTDPDVDVHAIPFSPVHGNFISQEEPDVPPTPGTGSGFDLIGRVNGNLWVGRSDGAQYISELWATGIAAWDHLTIVDTNGDGLDDIVGVANGRWWIAVSNGSEFEVHDAGATPANLNLNELKTGDFDGDGLGDLAVRDAQGNWHVARSTGLAFNNEVWGVWSSAVTWRNITVGDFDGDGRDDLIGRTPANAWWVATSDGTQFTNQNFGRWSNAVHWIDIVVGDFNGDLRTDVAGRAASGAWWVSHSTGTAFVATKWGVWSNKVAWHHVQVADIDGDDQMDIVARTSNGRWWVARSTGTNFVTSYVAHWSANINWTDINIGDVNDDGEDELLGRANGTWWVTSSDDEGKFSSKAWGAWSTAVNWDWIELGDFS